MPDGFTASTEITLGMPQLDGCGLSESWLQKTCGEIHWRGLADSLGRPAEQWTDAAGQRVYAAFGLVRLHEGRLDSAREGQALQLHSRLEAVGRSQAWSRHRLQTPDGNIGSLEMLSVFVGRGDDGSNRSVRRVPMREQGRQTWPDAQALADQARALRVRTSAAAWRTDGPALTFMPCPRGDFNGAGLVYFPSFTVWSDRALFGWGRLAPTDRVTARECLFLGNQDMGQPVEVVWCGETVTAGGRCLEVQLRCPTHRRLLALVRTTTARAESEFQPGHRHERIDHQGEDTHLQ